MNLPAGTKTKIIEIVCDAWFVFVEYFATVEADGGRHPIALSALRYLDSTDLPESIQISTVLNAPLLPGVEPPMFPYKEPAKV